MTVSAPPRLAVRTVTATLPASLLDAVPAHVAAADLLSWVRERDGLVGWGRAASCLTHGHDRFADADSWWAGLVAGSQVEDTVGVPGTGLVAFGAFAFADGSPTGGTLVVPEVVVGRRDGVSWVTTVSALAGDLDQAGDGNDGDRGRGPDQGHRNGSGFPGSRDGARAAGGRHRMRNVTVRDGAVPSARWPSVVAGAVRRISAGEVDKVVLARDVVVESDEPIALRPVLARLTERYTATWTFAVDGLVGATPEMLVRLQDGQVRSRVLAGTMRRDTEPAPLVTEPHPELAEHHTSDPRLRLITSDKDLEEHQFAVRSVAEVLAVHCTSLTVPTEPFVLDLPDVYHLATDLSGVPRPGTTSLTLAAALHPSAAVCGTPRVPAQAMIAELEQMDRGRYSGPVGWMDSAGAGDWGIALRCGQLAGDGRSMRLLAGGGIVEASDPEAELAETEVKLAAMRHALEV